MRMRSVQHLLEPILEPLIRRVKYVIGVMCFSVKEKVDLARRKHLTNMKRNCGKEMHASESCSLQLQFSNNLSLPIFTGTRIEGEDCSNLKVALIDALTGQIVNSGPESSAKVEIVVLEGDFDGDESDNWTLEEFKNNIVREREGKKPLLTGDVCLNLKEGDGLVGEIYFTDNSSWTRSRKFRLGARVVDNSDGTRIREAITESFIVRDHRGECEYFYFILFFSCDISRLLDRDNSHLTQMLMILNGTLPFLFIIYFLCVCALVFFSFKKIFNRSKE
ncbi:hypothetical protein L1049_027351 [Liquidambar formosana]|uniref:Calmodulin binding protein-like N-terminal domain-containing protein n=1 Tax=Liquidambar formosana TaxID=63359 RepID=A0AAP0WVA3_LIQFO